MGVALVEKNRETLKMPFDSGQDDGYRFVGGDVVSIYKQKDNPVLKKVIVRGHCLNGGLVVVEARKNKRDSTTEAWIIEPDNGLWAQAKSGQRESPVMVSEYSPKSEFFARVITDLHIQSGGIATFRGKCDDGSSVIITASREKSRTPTGLTKAVIVESNPDSQRRYQVIRANH